MNSYTLFDTSVMHKPSFTHTNSNLVDFPLSNSVLIWSQLNSVCLQLLVYQLDHTGN